MAGVGCTCSCGHKRSRGAPAILPTSPPPNTHMHSDTQVKLTTHAGPARESDKAISTISLMEATVIESEWLSGIPHTPADTGFDDMMLQARDLPTLTILTRSAAAGWYKENLIDSTFFFLLEGVWTRLVCLPLPLCTVATLLK